jgi:hypothetical protein
LKIRARSEGAIQFPLAQAEDLIAQVNERSRTGHVERFYVRGQLCYEGLPWRGELWLSDGLRLGPPSVCDETVLLSTRIIMVDALVAGIDRVNAGSAFQVILRELSVFLSVVMRKEVRTPRNGLVWVWTAAPTQQIECDMRNLGYYEKDCPTR